MVEPQAVSAPQAQTGMLGVDEVKKRTESSMDYYKQLGIGNCVGFGLAVMTIALEKTGRVNTEVKSLRNAWRIRQNLDTREFAPYFNKKALFKTESGQEPQRFVKYEAGQFEYTPLEPQQAQRIWNELRSAKPGTALTVLYARTLTGEEQGRGEDDPSHMLVCLGNGIWVDEINNKINVYDLNTEKGFEAFGAKFKFIENSMLFSFREEKFPVAAREPIEITADTIGFARGKEMVSPVEYAAEIRALTGIPFEYIFAEILNQNGIAGDTASIRREEARVRLRLPAGRDIYGQAIAHADTLIQRISGQ